MKILNKAALEDFYQYLDYSKKSEDSRKAKGLYTLDIDDIVDDVCYEMALKDFEFSGNEVMSKPGRHQVIRPGDIWEEPLFKMKTNKHFTNAMGSKL